MAWSDKVLKDRRVLTDDLDVHRGTGGGTLRELVHGDIHTSQILPYGFLHLGQGLEGVVAPVLEVHELR